MATIFEFFLESIIEIVLSIGGVRVGLFIFFLVLTIFFVATASYISAGITGVITLTIASTFRRRSQARLEE